MIVEGGAVLFTDEVLKDEKNIRKLIYNILKDTDTSIEIIALNDTRRRGLDFSCIFKITFNKKFDTYFKTISNSIYNITAPRVLIIKLLIGYPHDEVANEVAIHKTLGAQTNILPICPSFLFHEEINNTTMTTNIGSAFYDLLKFKRNTMKSFVILLTITNLKQVRNFKICLLWNLLNVLVIRTFMKKLLQILPARHVLRGLFIDI